jgi:hypothetical protein
MSSVPLSSFFDFTKSTPVIIETRVFTLSILATALLSREGPAIIAYLLRHLTTVGTISSKIEWLLELPSLIDRMTAVDCPLSQKSQDTLAELKWDQLR